MNIGKERRIIEFEPIDLPGAPVERPRPVEAPKEPVKTP